MRSVWYGLVLAAWAVANAQSTVPQDEQQSRILALENAWNQAVQQKDVKALDPLLAEGLVYIEYDGTEMNKEQYLARLSAPTLHFERVVNESMRVQSFGQSVMVVGVYREQGVKNGKAYMHHERFIDTWVRRGNSWMCVASQSTLMSEK